VIRSICQEKSATKNAALSITYKII